MRVCTKIYEVSRRPDMNEIKHANQSALPVTHKSGHEDYEYYRRDFLRSFLPRGEGGKAVVSVYEIPPGKSAYPYHYHLKNEEVFYILSGQGLLKTPDGEKNVASGDFLFFPANAEGAHKLTNISATEWLVYIDFDVVHEIDVAVYPDSRKIGIWGKDTNRVYTLDSDVDYYKDE